MQDPILLSILRGTSSELVLRDENEDFRNGAAHESATVINLHAEIQLDLLRSRNAARQYENHLRRYRSLQGKAGLRGTRDTR